MITTIRLAAKTALRPTNFKLNLLSSKYLTATRFQQRSLNTSFVRNACNSGDKGNNCCGGTSKNKMTKKSTNICGGKDEVVEEKHGVPSFCGSKKDDAEDEESNDDSCGEKKVQCSDSHEKFKQDVEEKEEVTDDCSETEAETSASESDEPKKECLEEGTNESEEVECSDAEDSTEGEDNKPATEGKAAAALCDCTTAALAKGIDKGKEALMKKVGGSASEVATNQCQKAKQGGSEKEKVSDKVPCCQVEKATSKSNEEPRKSGVKKCKENVKNTKKKQGKPLSLSSVDEQYGDSAEARKIEDQCGCIRKALEKCKAPRTSFPTTPSRTPDEKKDTRQENKPVKGIEEANTEKFPSKDDKQKTNQNGKKEKKKPDEKENTDTKICNATRAGRKKRPVTKVCK